MTSATVETAASAPRADALLKRSWKVPILLGVFAVLGFVLLVPFARNEKTVLTLSSSTDTVRLPGIPISSPAVIEVIAAIVLVLMAIGSILLVRARRRTPLWYLLVFVIVLVLGFLFWAHAGAAALPLTSILVGSLGLSAPLVFGGLGGVISERVGVTNVAIEAQLLLGSFLAAILASLTHNAIVGMVGAMVAGMLVSFVLGAFTIKYAVNQVIVGIVLNVLVLGLTTFLYQQVLVGDQTGLNSTPLLTNIQIPGLSAIPIIGPLFFGQTLIVYLMYIAVAAIFVGMFRTRWGLRLRSVGEHPQAADTVGINVGRTRFWNLALAGAIAGLGGAYYTLASVPHFTQNITNGAGYIALAAVILGRWDPLRVTIVALIFGFAQEVGYEVSNVGSAIPNQFMLMLPYLVTIFAVAGVVGRVRGPAAAGQPYVKG